MADRNIRIININIYQRTNFLYNFICILSRCSPGLLLFQDIHVACIELDRQWRVINRDRILEQESLFVPLGHPSSLSLFKNVLKKVIDSSCLTLRPRWMTR